MLHVELKLFFCDEFWRPQLVSSRFRREAFSEWNFAMFFLCEAFMFMLTLIDVCLIRVASSGCIASGASSGKLNNCAHKVQSCEMSSGGWMMKFSLFPSISSAFEICVQITQARVGSDKKKKIAHKYSNIRKYGQFKHHKRFIFHALDERIRTATVGWARECEAERSQDQFYSIAVGYLWSIRKTNKLAGKVNGAINTRPPIANKSSS